jgi:hypothetical protein
MTAAVIVKRSRGTEREIHMYVLLEIPHVD